MGLVGLMGRPSVELISLVEKASECNLLPGSLDRLRKSELVELFLELLGVDGVVSTVLSAADTSGSVAPDPNLAEAATVAAAEAASGGGATGVRESAVTAPVDGERPLPVCRHTWNRRACQDDACSRAHPPLCPYDSCEGKQAGCQLFHGRRKRIRTDKRKPPGKPKPAPRSAPTRKQGNGSRGRKASPTLQEFADFARLMGPVFPSFVASQQQLPSRPPVAMLPSKAPSVWPELPRPVPKLPPQQQMSVAGFAHGQQDVNGIVAALRELEAKVAALTGC